VLLSDLVLHARAAGEGLQSDLIQALRELLGPAPERAVQHRWDVPKRVLNGLCGLSSLHACTLGGGCLHVKRLPAYGERRRTGQIR